MKQRITSHDVGECDPDCFKCRQDSKASEAYHNYLEENGIKEADLSFEEFEQHHLTSMVNNNLMTESDARDSGWRGSVGE